ncbi:hypothetical protein CROQUDRAFT_419180 [Cronartium quercuum f. sp. fusiforme G11]|uniref:Uncharacterized protein n=1 Tax=Cronartium quercuum f. sp. fusiforme G11 TaxID=708437 RepID=A0A9P6NJI3_9BASI|nr:hypothetical protein CROQUDRAFT_419180 [Cronartium quercuum f. sp. fusiforme G11]
MKNWLVENKHVWSRMAHKGFEVAQTKYLVIFNYVLADLKVESPNFINDISGQNSIPIEESHSVCWLIDLTTTKKKHSSIVINKLLKELAKLMERGGIYAECNRLRGKKYTQAPMMCFRCLNNQSYPAYLQ